MLTRSVRIGDVQAVLGGARRAGVDVLALTDGAGIGRALLDDPGSCVSPEQFARLVRCVWVALDDELLGLAQAAHRLGTFATMCHAVVHRSSDLAGALHRAGRFYQILPPAISFHLERTPDGAAVEFELAPREDPDQFVLRSFMAVVHRFSGWLVGRRIPLQAVEFEHPAPHDVLEYDLVFGCPVRFGAPRTALCLPARYLQLPVVRDEPALRGYLRRSPEEFLARRDYAVSAAARVRRVLARADPADLPGLEAVAARLAVPSQSLRRQLTDEGTSFTTVRDQLRRDLAVAQLGRRDLSVEEVSRRLGFSEPSAFHRAFKRWTGSTPRAYRADR